MRGGKGAGERKSGKMYKVFVPSAGMLAEPMTFNVIEYGYVKST